MDKLKLIVKKSYCPRCHRLVKPREESSNKLLRAICPRCRVVLYTWNGLWWR